MITAEESTGVASPQCRICLGDDVSHTLIAPCCCIGSLQFVHTACLQQWWSIQLQAKHDDQELQELMVDINNHQHSSSSSRDLCDNSSVLCELCKSPYHLSFQPVFNCSLSLLTSSATRIPLLLHSLQSVMIASQAAAVIAFFFASRQHLAATSVDQYHLYLFTADAASESIVLTIVTMTLVLLCITALLCSIKQMIEALSTYVIVNNGNGGSVSSSSTNNESSALALVASQTSPAATSEGSRTRVTELKRSVRVDDQNMKARRAMLSRIQVLAAAAAVSVSAAARESQVLQ